MKLEFNDIKIERSASFDSQSFDIGDKRIILEILRGKLYSNPIQTICQEISTNARDAHSEVGKSDVPIEIKLPNKLDPSFWIRDFGPGISPDRMGNVFIQYGRSTKRGDNTQHGGFGIGSKSPFSYSDTFTVVSITPENDKLVRREYLAHIDESGLGQMSCVKQEITTEPQGTAVVLFPKESDWYSFTNYTIRAATHWPVRPNIVGDPEFSWPEYKISYKGSDWEIHENSPIEHVPYALIGGIPYILNLRHLYPSGYSLIANISLRLHFKIGEVPVTANREEIDYQSHVITYIKERIDKAVKEFQTLLTSSLTSAKTLRAAVILWQDLRRKPYKDFLLQTTWNNITLREFELIKLDAKDCRVSHFRRTGDALFGCRKTSDGKTIHIGATNLLIEDDLKAKGIQKARLSTLFDRYPNITYVDVIDFSKKIDKVVLPTGESVTQVTIVEDSVIDARRKDLEKYCHWSSLEPIKLSSIPKKKIVYVESAEKKKYKVVKTKKFEVISEHNYDWVEIEPDVLNDKKPKLYLTLANKSIQWRDEQKIQTRDLYTISTAINKMRALIDPKDTAPITIYGVVPSHVAKLEDNCKSYYQYAAHIMNEYKKVLPTQFGSDYAFGRKFSGYANTTLNNQRLLAKLSDKSLLKEYISESNKNNDSAALIGMYNDNSSYFGMDYISHKAENNKELKRLYEAVIKRYPLIQALSHYYGNAVMEDDIILYLNLKDAELSGSQPGQTS